MIGIESIQMLKILSYFPLIAYLSGLVGAIKMVSDAKDNDED